jgi:hypothetical protein
MWRRYLLTAVVVGLAGCAWTSESPQNPDRFESDPAERAYSRHIAAHRAQGAAADAMLLPRHFDGDQLNSLGRAKLTDIVMATADRHGPVVVYPVPAGAGANGAEVRRRPRLHDGRGHSRGTGRAAGRAESGHRFARVPALRKTLSEHRGETRSAPRGTAVGRESWRDNAEHERHAGEVTRLARGRRRHDLSTCHRQRHSPERHWRFEPDVLFRQRPNLDGRPVPLAQQ